MGVQARSVGIGGLWKSLLRSGPHAPSRRNSRDHRPPFLARMPPGVDSHGLLFLVRWPLPALQPCCALWRCLGGIPLQEALLGCRRRRLARNNRFSRAHRSPLPVTWPRSGLFRDDFDGFARCVHTLWSTPQLAPQRCGSCHGFDPGFRGATGAGRHRLPGTYGLF